MEKFDSRYDSNTNGSRISMMSEFVSIIFNSLRKEIDENIDRLAWKIEQLCSMGSILHDGFYWNPCHFPNMFVAPKAAMILTSIQKLVNQNIAAMTLPQGRRYPYRRR